ncbi:MAG: hypothetical protein JNK82_11530 [Myxococcaceae bacterium]|nr:hypothetical protein [Myxococcaceae bacterium]
MSAKARAIARFFIAVGAPSAAAWLFHRLFIEGRAFELTTDIVGWPAVGAFDIYQLFWPYYLTVLFVPPAAALLYHLLGRAWPNSAWPDDSTNDAPRDDAEPTGALLLASQVARALAAGAVIGVAVSLIDPTGSTRFWLDVAVGALGYTALVGGVALTRGAAAAARVNAVGACFSFVAVGAASSLTAMTVGSTGVRHAYDWFPLWLTALAVIVAAGATAWRLSRATTLAQLRAIERDALIFIAAPVAVFVCTAALPGALPDFDVYHHGELLVVTQLLADGGFPWRDIVPIHGVFTDGFEGLLGYAAFGPTAWGATSAYSMFLVPLCWASNLVLLGVMLRRAPLLFATAVVAVLSGTFGELAQHRFLLMPWVLLTMLALLDRFTWLRAAGFAAALFFGNVLVPELAYLVPAAAFALIAFEASRREAGSPWLGAFPRTLAVAGCSLVLLAGWLVFLAAHGAAGDFVRYYTTFARGHALTGGLPLGGFPGELQDYGWRPTRLWFNVLFPPAIVLLAAWYVVARLRSKKPLAAHDALIAAVAIFAALYYQKLLSRADPSHIALAMSPSAPLIFYAPLKLGELFRHVWARRALHAAVAVAVVMTAINSNKSPVASRLAAVPSSFTRTVEGPPVLERLGWSSPALNARAAPWVELGRFFDAHLAPGERVYDFTNRPGVIHYLLKRPPPSKYFHASLAVRPPTQLAAIAELERARPRLVVFDHPTEAFVWDGIELHVRHHELASWLLRTYRPFATVAGNLVYARNDDPAPALPGALAASRECTWGFSPRFLELGLERGPKLTLGEPAVLPADTQLEGLLLNITAARDDKVELVDGAVVVASFEVTAGGPHVYRLRLDGCPRFATRSRRALSLRHDDAVRLDDVWALHRLR